MFSPSLLHTNNTRKGQGQIAYLLCVHVYIECHLAVPAHEEKSTAVADNLSWDAIWLPVEVSVDIQQVIHWYIPVSCQ